MRKTYDFYKDVFVGVFFITGLFGFLSGEFVVSTVLFCAATLFSNINLGGEPVKY